ncbi:LOW QUALITY PROTEIN: hypothetical protein AAY473_025532 [Plecturocebus cupreus]
MVCWLEGLARSSPHSGGGGYTKMSTSRERWGSWEVHHKVCPPLYGGIMGLEGILTVLRMRPCRIQMEGWELSEVEVLEVKFQVKSWDSHVSVLGFLPSSGSGCVRIKGGSQIANLCYRLWLPFSGCLAHCSVMRNSAILSFGFDEVLVLWAVASSDRMSPSQPTCSLFLCGSRRVLLCCPGWSAVAQSHLTAALTSWAQTILPQPPDWDYRFKPLLVQSFAFVSVAQYQGTANQSDQEDE